MTNKLESKTESLITNSMPCLRWPAQSNQSASTAPQSSHGASLALFFHVAKTGGTSLVDWAVRHSRARRRRRRKDHKVAPDERPIWDLVVGGGCAPCYLCAYYSSLLSCDATTACHDPRDVRAAEASPEAWRGRHVFVEIHTPGVAAFYLNFVSPRMPRLRELYRRHERGVALALTALREPIAHVLSCWRFRPPTCGVSRAFPSSVRLCRTFDAWLRTASGLQAGALTAPRPQHAASPAIRPTTTASAESATGPADDEARDASTDSHPNVYTTPNPTSSGMNNPRGCAVRGEAAAELRRFDLLGTTERMAQLIAALRRHLRLPSASNETIGAIRPWAGMAESEHTFYFNESRAVTWQAVSNETRARWLVAAECDRELYLYAGREHSSLCTAVDPSR